MSKSSTNQESAEQHVKSIRRATRKQYSAEEKIRIVLEGLRGEYSIAELCRRDPQNPKTPYVSVMANLGFHKVIRGFSG